MAVIKTSGAACVNSVRNRSGDTRTPRQTAAPQQPFRARRKAVLESRAQSMHACIPGRPSKVPSRHCGAAGLSTDAQRLQAWQSTDQLTSGEVFGPQKSRAYFL